MPPADLAWLSALLETSGAAMVGVDLEGLTVYWSRGAEALFGWTADMVLGRIPPIVPEPLLQEWQLQLQRVLQTGQATQAAETQALAADGRVIPVVRSSSPLIGADGQVLGVLDTLMDITALKQLDDESRALAQVRERELIAMDLHDGLIQSLYAVVLSLATQERLLDPGLDDARRAIKAGRTEVERVIEETRSYVFNLRSREFSPPSLESGLRLLADGLRLNAPLDVELHFDPSVEGLLQPATRGHLLYLVREAVSNIVRHARASRVRIELARGRNGVVLSIEDNGRGLNHASRRRRGQRQRGLHNMAERARLVGGKLDMASPEGRGTRVFLEVPLSVS